MASTGEDYDPIQMTDEQRRRWFGKDEAEVDVELSEIAKIKQQYDNAAYMLMITMAENEELKNNPRIEEQIEYKTKYVPKQLAMQLS